MEAKNTINEHPAPALNSIVSVNTRGGESTNWMSKAIFIFMVVAIIVLASIFGFNKYRKEKKAEENKVAEQQKKEQNPSASATGRRIFDTDPPPLPPGSQSSSQNGTQIAQGADCTDGSVSSILLSNDGSPVKAASGVPMRVCKDGHIINPNNPATTTPTTSTNTQPTISRYSGDVIIPAANTAMLATGAATSNGYNPMAMLAQSLSANQMNGRGMMPTGLYQSPLPQNAQPPASIPNPQGAIGPLLQGNQTEKVSATKLGDRNMILPKGRTIDCSLSTRVISEVSGMATCVLTANVYSDNGKILLLERGSEAVGDYTAMMSPGQRRLFLLWTRIKTPAGIIINLNSPAADGLGTMGLDGYLDNRWTERIGAAFLLSFVQDFIKYETAKSSNNTGNGGGTNIYQNSAQTGQSIAQQVLANTINIKPTLYKNQGDRVEIFVARDLDFSTVYALRAD
ncbi:type IV secretion system protein VirB10 (plasmid) [Ampullimonas aquatilis]|uniref:type IV secretion system protein VirB10 n=1 Tax=Ampullimonas aquatilis TaxID=1341549 RepID=UPI003C755F00